MVLAVLVFSLTYPGSVPFRMYQPGFIRQLLGSWVLTRYADVKAALLDQRLSAALTRAFLADAVGVFTARALAEHAVTNTSPAGERTISHRDLVCHHRPLLRSRSEEHIYRVSSSSLLMKISRSAGTSYALSRL